MTRWCNIEKARKALDYQSLYSLDEGIRLSAEVCANQALHAYQTLIRSQYSQKNQSPESRGGQK
jgi:hypothetical protein